MSSLTVPPLGIFVVALVALLLTSVLVLILFAALLLLALVVSAFTALLLLALVVSAFTVLLEVLVADTSADTGRLVTSIPNPSENNETPITAQFLPHLYNL